MVEGPAAGLALLDAVEPQLPGYHRLDAVHGHLQEMADDPDAAILHYRAAASRTTSLAERNYLTTRANRLAVEPTAPPGPGQQPPVAARSSHDSKA
jgi:predicted RNA polymerase sigma factor